MAIYGKRHQVQIAREHARPRTAPWIGRAQRESFVERLIGAPDMEAIRRSSMEMHIPIPIWGTGAFVYKGDMYPVIAGGAGFSSLSDLISEATTGGKLQQLGFSKVGATGVVGRASTLWYAGNIPGVGATAAALAAGTNHTRATAGAIGPQKNAAGGDTLHLLKADGGISVAAQPLLLYDRIWAGEPLITSAVAQTVTMTPTRYETTGAAGTSKGNMVFAEVRTTLGAATPNLTLQYVDDSGNAPENAAAVVGITGAVTPTFPYGSAALGLMFIPLNAGDAGVSDITQWTQSVSYVSGAYAIVLAHPLLWIPAVMLANGGYIIDGINSAFNLQRVYDDACLALLEPIRPVTTATTYQGMLTMCSG